MSMWTLCGTSLNNCGNLKKFLSTGGKKMSLLSSERAQKKNLCTCACCRPTGWKTALWKRNLGLWWMPRWTWASSVPSDCWEGWWHPWVALGQVLKAGSGIWSLHLLSTDEPGVQCPVLGSPGETWACRRERVQQRTTKMMKGLEHLLWRKAERAGAAQPGKQEAHGDLINIHTSLSRLQRRWGQAHFSGVHARTRGSGHKVEHRRFTQMTFKGPCQPPQPSCDKLAFYVCCHSFWTLLFFHCRSF